MADQPIQSTVFATASGTYKLRWRNKGRNWQKTFNSHVARQRRAIL